MGKETARQRSRVCLMVELHNNLKCYPEVTILQIIELGCTS
jgi:hypothetical protein